MLKPYKIPVSLLVIAATFIVGGEVAAGTQPYFAACVGATLLCIGVTYNILGGISTLSGLGYAGFAVSTLVISQCAKVLFLERADRPLESPVLTIEVYFVFYFCLMAGCFVYSRLRARVPRPLEPDTPAQADLLYLISLALGLPATLVFEYYESSTDTGSRASAGHSIGLALSNLLIFALVLAVQARIRKTGGARSIDYKVLIPWVAIALAGLIEVKRAHIMQPAFVYILTCYFSGFRFRRSHYIFGAVGMAFFAFVLTPFELYARGPMRERDFYGRIEETQNLIANLPSWSVVQQASLGGVESGSREDYFERPGTFLLTRFAGIRFDSNMINACASGYHYGFTALKMDIARNMPRFLVKNKPEDDSAAFTGRVTGVNPDDVENGEFIITAISDSFGAFGWLGVVTVALIVFPSLFVLYESMFDCRHPWGMVAAGIFCSQFFEADLGKILVIALRTPAVILLLSYAMGSIVRMIPVKGDASSLAKYGSAA